MDPISNMLTQIRNAQMARHNEVFVPSSKIKTAIAGILERYKFVKAVLPVSVEERPFLKITLRYTNPTRTMKEPAIHEIRRVSRQGQRRYIGHREIFRVKNGLGISVISTSQGVMSGDEARKRGLGGEYVCLVW